MEKKEFEVKEGGEQGQSAEKRVGKPEREQAPICSKCRKDIRNCDCLVKVELKKREIPILLGAIDLGMVLEEGCFHLAYSYDTIAISRSDFHWSNSACTTSESIMEQTKIKYMEFGWADSSFMDEIGEFVKKQCGIYEKEKKAYEESLYEAEEKKKKKIKK
jgi:hypothetical protein